MQSRSGSILMIVKLFRRAGNQKLIERMHADIVAAARQPALFGEYAIPDTFEGRFESVILHATLVLRRLKSLPAPAPEAAQDLADTMFRHFDVALREMGVGDTSVPKRMKSLAEAFLGRSLAYDEALRGAPAALDTALQRNIYADQKDARRLARYVRAVEAAFAALTLDDMLGASLPFPAAAGIA